MDDLPDNIRRSIGRPALSFIRIYFDYDEAIKRSKCKIDGCKTSLAGRHSSNLEKHITRHHPEQAHTIMMERRRCGYERNSNDFPVLKPDESGLLYKRPLSDCSEESMPGCSRLQEQVTNPKRRHCDTIQIHMDKKELIESCIELVTTNGHPFTILEDSGFQRLVDPIVQALRENDPYFSVNRFNIQHYIQSEASHIREEIKSEIKGHVIPVKVDIVSRLGRFVMGVNIQLCQEGRVVLRNLGVKEIFGHHATETLQKEILQILEEYGIVPNMIYCIIIDNASSMVRTVQLVSKMGDQHLEEESQESDEDEGSMNNIKLKCNLPTSKDEKWPVSFDNLPSQLESIGVAGLWCAAHTLQLAVDDVLKCESTISVLNEARNLCRKLSTATSVGILQKLGHTKPLLDCQTCWQSTLDMIDSLLPLQDVCMDVMLQSTCNEENIHFPESFWEELEHICHAFQPAKIAAKKFKLEQLLVGDFLEVWLKCKYNIHSIGSTLAQTLYSAMDKREQMLFESPAIVSALYFDCRWHVMLSAGQRKMAEDYLLQLWNKIQVFVWKPKIEEVSSLSNSEHSSEQDKSPLYDDDPLEYMLRLREKEIYLKIAVPELKEVREIICAFAKTPRIPRTSNILEYWETKKSSDPECYLLATTVLAIPFTQVSANRTLSDLTFVFRTLRSRQDSQLVNDILLVRCNRIFQEEGNFGNSHLSDGTETFTHNIRGRWGTVRQKLNTY